MSDAIQEAARLLRQALVQATTEGRHPSYLVILAKALDEVESLRMWEPFDPRSVES
jgi:hypothetical protein